MLLVRACGAETFVPWTLLERAGVQRQTVLATQRMYIYIRMRRCGVYGLAICYHRIVCVVFL